MVALAILLFVGCALLLPTMIVTAHDHNRNSESATACTWLSPPVPGTELIAMGYDIVAVEWREPIFELTFNPSNCWFNPYLNEYQIYPEEVSLTPTGGGEFRFNSTNIDSWHAAYSIMDGWNGGIANFGLGGAADLFAAWARIKVEVNALFAEETRNFGWGIDDVSLYSLSVSPYATLTPGVQSYIAALPANISGAQDWIPYWNMIAALGTHVPGIGGAEFGARINMTTAYDKQLIVEFGADFVLREQLLALVWLEIALGINAGRANITAHVDERYAEASSTTYEAVGGRVEILAAFGLAAWMQTIPLLPVPILNRVQFVPLFNIIEDDARRANMHAALVNYCNGVSPQSASHS